MKRKLVTIGFVLTLIWGILIGLPSIASANHLPVMYVQVPQWADDWAVCAVDIPDAKCHWYVVCLLYTSPSPRDMWTSRMPSSA